MRNQLFSINATIKNILIKIHIHQLFLCTYKPLVFIANFISLSKWISKKQNNKLFLHTALIRDYKKRQTLYQYVIDKYNLTNESIDYIEMGVCGGGSFEWWIKSNQNPNSRFYGFDTFEGLPEKWSILFNSGDMYAEVPTLHDTRGKFIKGLFQNTLVPFLHENKFEANTRKVIHMDADLYSSTLFSLSMLYPYLQKGDIIFFDEFNVPNHEFLAWKNFTESFYVQYELIGAVNNYYQIAVEIK